MKKPYLFQCVISVILLLSAIVSKADVILPSIDNRYVSVVEINPTRDAGYVVGDKLERTIKLTVKKPYQLVKESLPIVGYEHRYRGQVSGIELAEINSTEQENNDSVTHTIHLVYQVFNAGKLAKPAILRGEIVKIRNTANKKELWQFRIPHFNFRISPLSVFGSVNLKQELSPFVTPLLIKDDKPKLILKASIATLVLSLLGLLYILGSSRWLPRMGGAFAKAYRDIGKTADTTDGLKQAVTRVHQALNQTAGHTVFAQAVDQFLTEKPAFLSVKSELTEFFNLSKIVFFEDSHAIDHIQHKKWLQNFCRHMRDCERGLNPGVA